MRNDMGGSLSVWGRRRLLLLIGGLFLAFGVMDQRSAPNASAVIRFNRDIRPILSDKCFICHGPDATAKKIRLRLDSETAATAEFGDRRRAIVPGDPGRSEMIRRITHPDQSMRMPPVGSNHSLTNAEIELLTEWIRQGAKWESHWSFIPPVRSELPAVRNRDWPRNEIDHFVLARLEQNGLQPSPEADRATLLRRLSFDLTGLPPTTEELDDFLNDKSPQAYEKVVDRLLGSPRYAERMAFEWLDAARYADTNGYQIDGERFMWRWRDWVIDAFKRDKPFDQFTIEQLAGDMLPNPTLNQRIATAFNRNHRLNSEDGIVPEEYQVEYVVDRVDTTSTVFLGLTMGCARCHNHKFDPLSQREYYQLYAYFNNIPEDGRAHNYGNSPPWISAPTNEQQRRLSQLNQQIRLASRELTTVTRANTTAIEQWGRGLAGGAPRQWFPSDNLIARHSLDEGRPIELLGTVDHIDMSKPDESLGTREKLDVTTTGYREGSPRFAPAPTGQGAAFDGKIFFDAGNIGNFNFRDRLIDYKDQFAISAWFLAENEQSGAIVTRIRETSYEKDNNLPKARGYGLFFNNGKLHFNIVGVWADDSYRVETLEPVSLNQWHQVVAVFDSTKPYDRARIYLDGREQRLKINNGRLFRTFNDEKGLLRIGGGGGPEYRFRGRIDEVRIFRTSPDDSTIAMLACPDPIESIASIPPARRSEGQRLKLLNAWIELASPPAVRRHQQSLTALINERRRLESQFPTVMVMEEMAQPRPTKILRRGAYDLPGESVTPGLPALLTNGRNEQHRKEQHRAQQPPANRLALAKWLVSNENPLTARVTVNRWWQMLFGTGIVKSVEDFGLQGELPSHPELLDWLAVEFRDGATKKTGDLDGSKKWSVRHLLRKIVLSATYRQSSRRSINTADPENRLLGRASRMRLPAEMIRDQALSVAGLLVEKTGGPSVKPYQPADLLKDLVFSNMTNYPQEKGEGLWRRSIYTYWRRTILNPGMLVFDASAREQCTVRETRTNTPLQALNLMNDVTYIEASRLLAERMLKSGAQTTQNRIAWAFRTVTSRQPEEAELRLLEKSLNAQLDRFRHDQPAAAKLLTIGEKRNQTSLNQAELAAHTIIASLILNLDEAITKP